MTISYLFYDIESTGLSKSFDQVLQFAAIRTDHRLKEIDRHDIKVKLRPDIIPSPLAILTNRIPISDLANGLCEYEATGRIHRLLNEPETISLGYNTLGFDDEFLRFSFHRNLLPPYTHQFRNGCRRMDLRRRSAPHGFQPSRDQRAHGRLCRNDRHRMPGHRPADAFEGIQTTAPLEPTGLTLDAS